MMNPETAYNGEDIIALINVDAHSLELLNQCDFGGIGFMLVTNGIDLNEQQKKLSLNIRAVISQSEVMAPLGVYVLKSLRDSKFPDVPFFLLVRQLSNELKQTAIESGVTDVFRLPLQKAQLESRVNFTLKKWSTLKGNRKTKVMPVYKTAPIKRLFDIVVSATALLLLSPVFLLVMCLLKLESKGAAFYYSLRVGTGYKVFRFYKFRSMYTNADKRLKDLKHLNQYSIEKNEQAETEAAGTFLCADCAASKTACQNQLFADGNMWCEKQYLFNRKAQGDSAFFKIKDDPRITKVGKILRNTSIDELPQLWNVLKGDMSIVGNRPLPLYEAEKLTTDKYALRFMAPAGITGLWQVEKRGKGEMSEDERLMLDNKYAINHSFGSDIRLILKTIPALFQKESV